MVLVAKSDNSKEQIKVCRIDLNKVPADEKIIGISTKMDPKTKESIATCDDSGQLSESDASNESTNESAKDDGQNRLLPKSTAAMAPFTTTTTTILGHKERVSLLKEKKEEQNAAPRVSAEKESDEEVVEDQDFDDGAGAGYLLV